jgi:hypothetical protein
MCGYLPDSGVTDFDARITMMELESQLNHLCCLVGLQSAYKDPNALLAEVTDVSAFMAIRHLCFDVVLLSNRQALIRTEAGTRLWESTLTDLMHQAPEGCVLKVKWKNHQYGGRPWAQPAATAQRLQAIRTQALVRKQSLAPRVAYTSSESELVLRGALGPDPACLLRLVMAAVAQKLGVILQERSAGQELSIGQWAMLCHPGTEEANGRIRLRLGNAEDARVLEDAIQNSPVRIGEQLAVLSVSNPLLSAIPGLSEGDRRGAPLPA